MYRHICKHAAEATCIDTYVNCGLCTHTKQRLPCRGSRAFWSDAEAAAYAAVWADAAAAAYAATAGPAAAAYAATGGPAAAGPICPGAARPVCAAAARPLCPAAARPICPAPRGLQLSPAGMNDGPMRMCLGMNLLEFPDGVDHLVAWRRSSRARLLEQYHPYDYGGHPGGRFPRPTCVLAVGGVQRRWLQHCARVGKEQLPRWLLLSVSISHGMPGLHPAHHPIAMQRRPQRLSVSLRIARLYGSLWLSGGTLTHFWCMRMTGCTTYTDYYGDYYGGPPIGYEPPGYGYPPPGYGGYEYGSSPSRFRGYGPAPG